MNKTRKPFSTKLYVLKDCTVGVNLQKKISIFFFFVNLWDKNRAFSTYIYKHMEDNGFLKKYIGC